MCIAVASPSMTERGTVIRSVDEARGVVRRTTNKPSFGIVATLM